MALLNKLFSGRKGGSKSNLKQEANIESSCWKPPVFNKDQIRVLLFRECDGRSRKLLFDSSSVKKLDPPPPVQRQCSSSSLAQKLKRNQTQSTPALSTQVPKTDIMEVTCDGVVYQYLRPKSDVKMLGEMIFGSVAMSYRGTTTKIHTIRSPLQLMFTKVYPAPIPNRDKELSDSLSSSSVDFTCKTTCSRQNDCLERLSSSVGSVDGPDWHSKHELDYNVGVSNRLRSTSSLNSLNVNTQADCHQPSLPHSGSYNSLQRRWLRCRTTSMEFGLPRKWDDSSFPENTMRNSLSSQKRSIIGMAVIFKLSEETSDDVQFQTFFFSHITLIENYINKLRIQIEKACQNRNCFVKLVMEGYEGLQKAICDLYLTPRLPDPVWISMMSDFNRRHIICLKFMTEFMGLVESLDTKGTKFFISTLLTAVLSHHLAWVPTVTPSGIPPSHSYHKKHKAKWLDMLAKSHPYNPLWVQLGDLYGAVGFPCKMAKTVIIGKKTELVRRLLYILSYFIRCSEVYENIEQRIIDADCVSVTSEQTLVASNTSSTEKLSVLHQKGEKASFRRSSESLPKTDNDGESSSEKEGTTPVSKEEDEECLKNEKLCEMCLQKVLSGSPLADDVKEQLRTSRKYCESCRKLYRRYKSRNEVRNGLVFDVAESQLEEVQVLDRDSGFSTCSSEDRSSRGSKTNTLLPSKVSFTIGDVPLQEICCTDRLLLKKKSDAQGFHLNHFGPSSQYQCCFCCGHSRPRRILKGDLLQLEIAENGIVKNNRKLTRVVSVSKNLMNCEDQENVDNGNRCDSGIGSEPISMDLSSTEETDSSKSQKTSSFELDLKEMNDDARSDGQCLIIDTNGTNGKVENTNGPLTDFIGLNDEYEFSKNIPNSMDLVSINHHGHITDIAKYANFPKDRIASKTKILCDPFERHSFHSSRNSNINKASRKRCALRRKLCKCNLGNKNSCSCRSQSDENLNKSNLMGEKVRLRHRSEAGLSYQLAKQDEMRENLLLQATELPLPRSIIKQAHNSADEYFRGFSWSLMTNYSDHYMADFILQGTDEVEFGSRLCSDLAVSVNNSPLDERVAEAICILADSNKWTVQVASNKTCNVETEILASIPVGMSQLVANTTETLLHLWKLKMSPEFCLMHLEDRLQEMYFKSQLLAEYLTEKSSCDIGEMTKVLGLDASDLPLLMAVASTHSPSVTCTYGVPYR